MLIYSFGIQIIEWENKYLNNRERLPSKFTISTGEPVTITEPLALQKER